MRHVKETFDSLYTGDCKMKIYMTRWNPPKWSVDIHFSNSRIVIVIGMQFNCSTRDLFFSVLSLFLAIAYRAPYNLCCQQEVSQPTHQNQPQISIQMSKPKPV
jgi:hypothetical protein